VEHPTAGRIKLTGYPIKISATNPEIKTLLLPNEHGKEIIARLLNEEKLES
jgi:hypothetical protein